MLRSIEIDFEVHKRIEIERKGFDETANEVLRRLLGIIPTKPSADGPVSPSLPAKKSWSDSGVTLPHGTLVRMVYGGRKHEGQILDGDWVIEDKVFDSPSGAASGVAISKKGTKVLLNGWNYWSVKRPGDLDWSPLDTRDKNALTLEDLGL